MALVDPAFGIRAVHRRRQIHLVQARAARRAGVARASRALLPAAGATRCRPPRYGARRVPADAGLRRRRFVHACPAARGPGGSAGRQRCAAGRGSRVDRPALGTPLRPRTGRQLNIRRLTVFLHDVLAAAAAWLLAWWLRFNLEIPDEFAEIMWRRLPLTIAAHGLVFWSLGLYRGIWRYASLPDLQRILVAAGIGALAVPALLAFLGLAEGVPRSVYLVAPVLMVVAMGGSRLAYRAWREGRLAPVVAKLQAMPVLVIGGGPTAAALLKELARSAQWRGGGLLGDHPRKRGAEVLGIKVLRPPPHGGAHSPPPGGSQGLISLPPTKH